MKRLSPMSDEEVRSLAAGLLGALRGIKPTRQADFDAQATIFSAAFFAIWKDRGGAITIDHLTPAIDQLGLTAAAGGWKLPAWWDFVLHIRSVGDPFPSFEETVAAFSAELERLANAGKPN